MAKFVHEAATIVGAIASVAAMIPGPWQPIAAVVAVAADVAAVATQLLIKPPSQAGLPTAWQANPDAGIPILFGDAYNSGFIIYRQAYGSDNKYQTLVTGWSLGPAHSIDQLYVDGVAKSVTAQQVDIEDQGKMYEARQLGLCPEPAQLTVAAVDPYGWTSAQKLSGLAATIVTFVYDAKGSHTFTSIPNCGWRGKGVLCYDPRKDSTYSGGSGAQRAGDQTTWAWSDNPYVVALTWCLGWRQNGKLAAGVGLSTSGILVDQFVEGMNVAEANGWKVGGVKATTDDKWDVLKDILQAGGGEPIRLGALLGCLISTPRVSLATIDRDSLAQGDISIQAMPARRDRINAVSPRYMAEQSVTSDDESGDPVTTITWNEISGAPIIVDDYVSADGRQRRKEISYPLVQCFAGDDPTQAAQLARYDIENAREFGPISLPLKIRWMGYKPGDCVTLNIPEAGLDDQDVLLLSRSLEPSNAVVTITARSESGGKHAFALGQIGTPPASPSVAVYDPNVVAPAAGSWTLTGATLSGTSGSIPALLLTGASDNNAADAIVVEYRLHVSGQADDAGWIGTVLAAPTMTKLDIASVAPSGSYDAAVRYRVRGTVGDRLILGPATAGTLAAATSTSATTATTLGGTIDAAYVASLKARLDASPY